jgi:hypothetical protein
MLAWIIFASVLRFVLGRGREHKRGLLNLAIGVAKRDQMPQRRSPSADRRHLRPGFSSRSDHHMD